MTRTEIWQLAIIWVKSNRVLIHCVAAQYSTHMGCSSQDLKGEALLVAQQVISSLFLNDKDLSHMGRYFRVVFRSRCIHMTMGVDVVEGLDIERVNIAKNDEEMLNHDLDQHVIETALLSLTKRQRQVAKWILRQDTPVSVNLIGQHFGITARGVRKLINNAIFRIKNGNHRVCKTIPAIP